MTLNPNVESLLAMMASGPSIDFATISADGARALFDMVPRFGETISVARVDEVLIALPGRTLDARLYLPEGAGENPPLTVYFHGGGWVLGTLDTHDSTCRILAQASKAAVLSVAYRRAPDHRYPAAVYDCFDAVKWAASNGTALGIDGTRLAVAGDSAGGNLAAAVAILARDAGGPALRHQLLIYPVTDDDFTRPSFVANGGGNYYLSTAGMQWFWDQYLGDTAVQDAPLAAILRWPDLAGVAPATVFTAQYDPLRDEGDAYARRLAESGVATDADCAPGMVHGFFNFFQLVPEAMPWIDRAGANLAKAFAQ